MSKKLAFLCATLTFLIIGSLTFIESQAINYPTILYFFKLVIPACIVVYCLGFLIGKILSQSKADTKMINTSAGQKFIDDLLLEPDNVLKSDGFIQTNDSADETNKEKNNSQNNEYQDELTDI